MQAEGEGWDRDGGHSSDRAGWRVRSRGGGTGVQLATCCQHPQQGSGWEMLRLRCHGNRMSGNE